KAYALNHHIPKKQKLEPRAHIGYLVGYDSTNIYRIWIPSRNKVIRSRDVTFDHASLYDPRDIDIGFLQNTVDTLLETLELPSIQEDSVDDEVYDTIVVDVTNTAQNTAQNTAKDSINLYTNLENQPTEATHLPSPRSTPDRQATLSTRVDSDVVPDVTSLPEATRNTASLPGTIGNTAPRRNDIYSDLDTSNILNTTRRNRHTAHVAALQQVSNLSGYHAAFSSAIRTTTTTPTPI